MAAAEVLPLRREAIGEGAKPLAERAGAVRFRILESLHVLALRHLPGGAGTVSQALQPLGIANLPAVGTMSAAPGPAGPWVVWRNPGEWTFITTDPAAAAAVERGLQAGAATGPACAVNQSDGTLTLELKGSRIDALLARLLDAASLPREAGHATRGRLADVAVTLLRHDDERLWLVADRSHDHYLAAWLAYAAAALDMPA